MRLKKFLRSLAIKLGIASVAMLGAVQAANAVQVNLDTWYEFAFDGPQTALVSGVGTMLATNAPGGDPIVQVGNAPWTITLTGPATLTVLDLFLSVDQFEMFDNLVSIGLTSAPTAGGACGTDITCALADARYSRMDYLLGAGDHSLTGLHPLGQAGAAVFQITESAVPEPASLGLFAAALAGFGLVRRRRQAA